ncbi:MAG: ABC transporter permease [Bacilli bacterium]
MSDKLKRYIYIKKRNKVLILLFQLGICIIFLTIWELLSKLNIINTFIFSSPSNILKTLLNLFNTNNLFIHIFTTSYETIIAFLITTVLSLIISILLYEFKTLSKIMDPYLTIFNSLPKVALGPIIIVWIGANNTSIIVMAVLISIIVSTQTIMTSFISTNKYKIKLMDTFNASKIQKLIYLVIPSNLKTIINTLKINVSMCLIGVVMGEFLTSKTGIGYLILYGSQVFNLNLVYAGILLLLIISIIMYKIIVIIENKVNKLY